jgi:hypothetical protein
MIITKQYRYSYQKSLSKYFITNVLWQYLKDNHGLNCAQSTFRTYISNKAEFQSYFDSGKRKSSKGEVIRFETSPAEQAQLAWKENIRYITKNGEILYVNVCVLTFPWFQKKKRLPGIVTAFILRPLSLQSHQE